MSELSEEKDLLPGNSLLRPDELRKIETRLDILSEIASENHSEAGWYTEDYLYDEKLDEWNDLSRKLNAHRMEQRRLTNATRV
jgi:hypothetical protein